MYECVLFVYFSFLWVGVVNCRDIVVFLINFGLCFNGDEYCGVLFNICGFIFKEGKYIVNIFVNELRSKKLSLEEERIDYGELL